MCGRFILYSSPGRIKNHFATINELNLEPRYNIAPAQTVPVIRADRQAGYNSCTVGINSILGGRH